MAFTWTEYFAQARALEARLMTLGTSRKRARALAEHLTAHPTNRKRAARLLAAVIQRRLTQQENSR